VDVYVTMTNEPKQVGQSQAMQKSGVGKLSSLRNSVIGMFNEKLGKKPKQQEPVNKQTYAMIVDSSPEVFLEEVKPNSYVTLKWRLQNQSQASWPVGVHLDLVYSHPRLYVKSTPVKHVL